jgi:large subunit ribosomal protein L24
MAQTKLKVKKGDLVQVISGKDRGKQGRVLESRPSDGRVIVENLNIVKRHTRPRPIKDSGRMGTPQIQPGGIVEKPAPLPAANVMVVCPTCKRATRVGIRYREVPGHDPVRVRYCKRADCGEDIDR